MKYKKHIGIANVHGSGNVNVQTACTIGNPVTGTAIEGAAHIVDDTASANDLGSGGKHTE